MAAIRSMWRRWVNHRWLVSTGHKPQWTCSKVLSGPERWRDPVWCETRISVVRRVLTGRCRKHRKS
jgi:hypothetical protein